MKNDIWPKELDILVRPERMRYIRKVIKPKGCVFCKSLKQGVGFNSLVLYKSKHSFIVMNKYPYNNGHLLILPQRHTGDLLDLSPAEYTDLHKSLRKAVKAIQDTYKPQGFNIGLNHGSVAGAGIPKHLHYHLIPRWYGDTNFFPLIAESKVIIETLEESFEKLVGCF